MADDNQSERGVEGAGPGLPAHEVGPIAVNTSDPAIDEERVEHRADWKIHPDSTVQIETAQVGEPSPLYVAGVRAVEKRDDGKGPRDGTKDQQGATAGTKVHEKSAEHAGGDREQDGSDGKGKEGNRSKDRDDHAGRRQSGNQPAMMKSLLITAGVALLGGLIGAVGYSYVFGTKSDSSSSGQSQKNGGSSSKGGTSSSGGSKAETGSSSSGGSSSSEDSDHEKGSGGIEDKESGRGLSKGGSSSSSRVESVSADEVRILKSRIMDLTERAASLSERVDQLNRRKEAVPTVLQTMQIEMVEVARKLADLTSLSGKVRDQENKLGSLQENVKFLRTRVESLATGRAQDSTSNVISPKSSVTPLSLPDSGTEGPTLKLGIHLLEKEQYASARAIFDRLQHIQPNDARVWYFGALAVGLVSGDWDDEAKELAEKGLERERAGTPRAAEIDASLAAFSRTKGEAWLNGLRRRSLSVNRTH